MTSMHDGRPALPGPPASTAGGVGVQSGSPRDDDASQDESPANLVDLRDRPLAEHADVYQDLHAQLQAALADIDNG